MGQVLRREGLYSSHLTTWRKAAHSGSLKALSKKRGRKPERNPLDEKVRKLERRNARLENELRKAHLIIDVQGKVAGAAGDKPRRRDKLLKAADELAKHVGVKPACAALEVSRSTLYRRRGPSTGQQQPRPTPARALSETERGEVFDTLCSERFVDRSPAEVVATLLDEEVYLCSERTMYRVLASEVPVQERRAQRTHPEYKKPELMATAPNQVWSWDITRLLGPKKWSYYYLYVIMDIYSRYVVGWMVADRENSALAGRLIQQSCLKHGVQPRVLTLSDRGAPMTSQCTAQLLADLGVTRSLSRPQVSDDNPFSEAQFKTLKYHPSFPGRVRGSGPSQDVLSIVLPLVQCRAPPWRHLDANPRAGPLRERRSGHCRQEIRAPRSMGRSSRTLRQRCAEAQTAPGGRLHQSSHPFPHHTGHCSLINPVECPIVVDRFRFVTRGSQRVRRKSGGVVTSP